MPLPECPKTQLQAIHNSPDPAASTVDLYVNGIKRADDLPYRDATPFVDVPADRKFELAIAPASSASSLDSVMRDSIQLTSGQDYVSAVNDTVGSLSVNASPIPSSVVGGSTGIKVHHGSEDADTVDVIETGIGVGKIVDDLPFPQFTPDQTVPTQDGYEFQVQNDSNVVTYGCYQADLASLNLGGEVITVFASGYLDTASGPGTSSFGVYAATRGGSVVSLPTCPTTKGQVIHNSPDPAADTVDLWVNGRKAVDDLPFRHATPFVDLPAGREFEVALAPKSSTSSLDSVKRDSVQLMENQEYIIVANGNVGGSPGLSFDVDTARQNASSSMNTDVLVHHGSPDAPTVDVVETGAGAGTLVDNISYPDYSNGYLELPTSDYILEVQNQAGDSTVGCFSAPLQTLGYGDSVITVLASGYLTPSNSPGDSAFGLFAAKQSGGPLVELPGCPSTKGQVIHNAPDTSASTVDVYINSKKAVDDLGFRTATPFVDLPSGRSVELVVAPGNSATVADSVYRDTVQLNSNNKYVLVADGILPSNSSSYSADSSFSIEAYDMARESAQIGGNTDVLVHHGSPDAGPVDVVETQVGAGTIVDNLVYSGYQGYLALNPTDYDLEVRDSTGSTTVACFDAPLQSLGLQDSAVTLVASGFLTPSQNANGPALGLYVALPKGDSLIELQQCPSSIQERSEGSLISVRPNPSRGRVQLSVPAGSFMDAQIRVFDMAGRKVYEAGDRNLENGQVEQLDLSGLEPGSYILRLSNDKRVESARITIAR